MRLRFAPALAGRRALLFLVAFVMLSSGIVSPITVHASTAAFQAVPRVVMDKPLDCESAALSSALQYQGYAVGQDWVFGQLPIDGRAPIMSGGQPAVWGNPYQAFVGSVWGSEGTTGYGVYAPPIINAARRAGAEAWGGEGQNINDLFNDVAAGYSVVVWAPMGMTYAAVSGMRTWDGATVWYSQHEHAQVLAGFDTGAGTVTLMDDFSGTYRTFSISLFADRFAAFHSTAVVVANPRVVPSAAPPVANLGRYYGGGLGHWATGGGVTDAYVRNDGAEEIAYGTPASAPYPGWTNQIFGCSSGWVHFLSFDAGCEGQTRLYPEGFTASSSAPDHPKAVYRCRARTNNDHFVSDRFDCEGQITEESLGFISNHVGLIRYYNGGHLSAIGAAHSGFRAEAMFGYLTSDPGTSPVALYECSVGADHFTSQDPGCEGQWLYGRLGFVSLFPPGGVSSVPLYRCFATSMGHFDTTSASCEGAGRRESLLGYLLTQA